MPSSIHPDVRLTHDQYSDYCEKLYYGVATRRWRHMSINGHR